MSSLFAIIGIVFNFGLLILISKYPGLIIHGWPIIILLGSAIAAYPYRSYAFFLEFTTIVLGQWVFELAGYHNQLFLYLLFICSIFISLDYRLDQKSYPALCWAGTGIWLIAGCSLKGYPSAFGDSVLLMVTFIMLSVYTLSAVLQKHIPIKNPDIIYFSASSNTAHYLNCFLEGMKQSCNSIKLHRFHYYRDFAADFQGDSLVIAFPVIGWKPPWPLFNYLLLRLPMGKGKPAYIIYTSAGGPENAGVLVWFLLTVKGYRVMGRSSAIYPINVAAIRIGPSKLWAWLDSLIPQKITLDNQIQSGLDFAQGKRTGLPFILWPSPLFIIGILTDNKMFDYIYRNHAFYKRCNGCGICVRYCPAERLFMKDKYPSAKGTCVLCFGCVNLCPTSAMQLWFLSEYGNQYPPKWRHLAVRKKD